MNNNSHSPVASQSALTLFTGWLFAIVFFAIGVVNLFWGNDPGFGAFIVLLSLVFIPPVTIVFTRLTGFVIPVWIKILIGIFIIWAALGVGELFDKIDLMLQSI